MRANKICVTAESTDEEIIAAINSAGEHKHPWRRYDWSNKPGANNTRSWVIPNDIGRSTRKNKSLLLRLRQMVKAGILEERCNGSRMMRINNFPCADTHVYCRGMPRFRVIPQ